MSGAGITRHDSLEVLHASTDGSKEWIRYTDHLADKAAAVKAEREACAVAAEFDRLNTRIAELEAENARLVQRVGENGEAYALLLKRAEAAEAKLEQASESL